MLLNVLAVGDVCAQTGAEFLGRHLRSLKKLHEVHFAVVNGENVSGVGVTPRQAQGLLDAGADVITLGNHTWNRLEIGEFLEESPYVLRPANFSPRTPGRGWGVYEGPRGLRIGVLNLLGRFEIDYNLDSPFAVADKILNEAEADVILVDFHAEATSEKGAMAFHLDGRVQALWGTHTHVPTADARVFPQGMGFVTDLGMTGPAVSVLGLDPEQALGRFLGSLPRRFEPAKGPCKLEGVVFSIDTQTRRCVSVRRVDIQE